MTFISHIWYLEGVFPSQYQHRESISAILLIPYSDHIGLVVTCQLKPGYHSLDIFKYNATYAAEQLALWENGQLSRWDDVLSSIAFLNWKQLVGDDTALLNLANQSFGNSTNVVDQAKLSFLSDYSVPQIEMVMSGSTTAASYPPQGDPLYGSDFVNIQGIHSKYIYHNFSLPATASGELVWL